ncbi:MAG: sulfocyanin-like copper-binding protein [Geitlerinemataceae cyanobacterium]
MENSGRRQKSVDTRTQWFSIIRSWLLGLTFLILWLSFVPPATAVTASVTEVKVSLGSPAGELKFFPNTFEFVAGQTYKLLLDNPSPQKHYFTSKDFADASWTRKVEAGNVEVKGAIRELELKSGAMAEWMFVPMKPGTYSLRCTIPGHAEAGMTGEIRITAP